MRGYETLERLTEIYDAIDFMGRRIAIREEHLKVTSGMSFSYTQKQRQSIADCERAIPRLKQLAIKEHLKLIEELR